MAGCQWGRTSLSRLGACSGGHLGATAPCAARVVIGPTKRRTGSSIARGWPFGTLGTWLGGSGLPCRTPERPRTMGAAPAILRRATLELACQRSWRPRRVVGRPPGPSARARPAVLFLGLRRVASRQGKALLSINSNPRRHTSQPRRRSDQPGYSPFTTDGLWCCVASRQSGGHENDSEYTPTAADVLDTYSRGGDAVS